MSVHVIGGLICGIVVFGGLSATMGYFYVGKRKEEIKKKKFNDSQKILIAGLVSAFIFNFLCIILTYVLNVRLSGAISAVSEIMRPR